MITDDLAEPITMEELAEARKRFLAQVKTDFVDKEDVTNNVNHSTNP